jgi:PhnB protein
MAITPYLLYEDVGEALKWLAKAFGFQIHDVPMSDAEGTIRHAAMKLGDDLIMMGCPGPKYKNPKRLGASTQSLYVNVDDVDKHFARAKKAGATILEEPADQFYGQRRYGAADPEGHQWYFAQDIDSSTTKKRSAGASKSKTTRKKK